MTTSGEHEHTNTLRLRSCVEAWPGCREGLYDPACCRFPKSCSCTVYATNIAPAMLERHYIISWIEGERAGWFKCSCGEAFITEGYDSEDKGMGAIFTAHLAAKGQSGEPDLRGTADHDRRQR